jgi:hypothetical protein
MESFPGVFFLGEPFEHALESDASLVGRLGRMPPLIADFHYGIDEDAAAWQVIVIR